MMKIVYDARQPSVFAIRRDGADTLELALDIQTIRRLEEKLDPRAMAFGLRVTVVGEPGEDRLVHELVMQAVYLSTVYAIYPRHFSKSRLRPAHMPGNFVEQRNLLENAKLFENMGDVRLLEGALAGDAALLAAPGPSLEPKRVRRLQDRCHIVAVGRAFAGLVRAGVEPDVFFTQDTHDVAWDEVADAIDGRRLDTVLVADPAGAVHRCFESFRSVWSTRELPGNGEAGRDHLDCIEPSSTSGAYSFCRLAGCNPLVFMGNDCGRLVDESACEDLFCGFGLPWEKRGQGRSFALLDHAKVRLRTECGCMEAKTDYVAAAQWLKMRIAEDSGQGLHVLDNSLTGLVRERSPARQFDDSASLGRSANLPMAAKVGHSQWETWKKRIAREYARLEEHFDHSNTIPEQARTRPFNCIFEGISSYESGLGELDSEEGRIVRRRLARLRRAAGLD